MTWDRSVVLPDFLHQLTDRHDITETYLKVVLNTIKLLYVLRDNQLSSNVYIIVLMWSSDECVSPINSICQEYWYVYSSPPFILVGTISREFNKDETYF